MTRSRAADYILQVKYLFDKANDNHRKALDMAFDVLKKPKVIRCKDCKYFEVKDHWQGMILGASDCPTCMRWAGGNCKTEPEGYCFLAERKE